MKTNTVLYLKILLILMFLITSCTNQGDLEQNDTAYPIDNVQLAELETSVWGDAAYPIDENDLNQEEFYLTDLVIPTPQAETAVVYGKLISLHDEEPYLAPSLFLGMVLSPDTNSENAPILTSVSIDDDPMAEQALDGTFLFRDVLPGKYGLIFWTPMSAFIIEDSKTGIPVFVEVEAGQTYDLGSIYLP